MSLILIDTDIASFVFKGSDYADPYLPLLSGQELALSFMTIAEGHSTSVGRSSPRTARAIFIELPRHSGRSAAVLRMGTGSERSPKCGTTDFSSRCLDSCNGYTP